LTNHGTEDELWDEHHDKSDTDSDEEGDEMYDDILTHEQIQQISMKIVMMTNFWVLNNCFDFSVAYTRVRL